MFHFHSWEYFPRCSERILMSIRSVLDLFDYISTGSQQPLNPETLLRHTHDLLSHLVQCIIKSLAKIGYASDVALLLGFLLPGAHYQSANCLTKDCAMSCHSIITTIFYFIHLKESEASHFLSHNTALLWSQFKDVLLL